MNENSLELTDKDLNLLLSELEMPSEPNAALKSAFMKSELFNLIQSKAPGSIPLYLVIRGSHAYGTNLPTSDIDFAGVFVQDLDSILGMSYIEQINDDNNDTVIYEVRRFLELLSKNNPTILELLNTPDDCVIYKDPAFDIVLENRNRFLTKVCSQSFGGYAVAQIKKARGQNKKQNWEKDKVTRKDVLDFVYVIEDEKSIPWKEWASNKKLDEKFCGVVNIPNARDTYALFYDSVAHDCFSELVPEDVRESAKFLRKQSDLPMGFGFKGLVKVDEGQNAGESNALRLSSIPKGMKPICNIIYNKDGYTQHCKDYKSYQTWLEERNEQRWIDVKSHDQKIDGKNMMHCRRLMDMAREIGEGKGIIVRRPNAGELIDIRQGKVDLQSLIDHVEAEIKAVDELYKNSTLPDFVDIKFVEEILLTIRKKIYNIK